MDRKKLPEQCFRPIAKRTTVYLPAKFKLQKPTLEINDKLHLLSNLLSKDTGNICPDFIFDAFKPIRKTDQHLISYQIILQDNHRLALGKIPQQTGLSVSKLIEYCFYND